MKDEEVGELWTAIQTSPRWAAEPVAALIRKLVEERAVRIVIQCKHGELWTDEEFKGAKHIVLRNFHIDPATWPEE